MKRTLITLSALFLLVSLNAQVRGGAGAGQGQRQQRTPEEMAKLQTEFLKENLKLDAKKEKSVYEIYLKFGKKQREEFAAMREQGDRTGMRDKMTKMNAERDEELKKILGDKDFEKYQKLMEDRRQNMRRRDG